jgi:hypothetical protein
MAPVAPHISAKTMSMGKRSRRLKRGESMMKPLGMILGRPWKGSRQGRGSRECKDRKQNEGGR